ncbi:MAG: hypothetical protein ACWA5U_01995 [bacterium]
MKTCPMLPMAYSLRWLKPDELSGSARHFAYFCQNNFDHYSQHKNFNQKHFNAAIKLVLEQLESPAFKPANK